MANCEYLKGRAEAAELNKHLTVAYYMDSVGLKSEAEYHYAAAVQDFYRIATAMGFIVQKIDAPAGQPLDFRGEVPALASAVVRDHQAMGLEAAE